MAKSRKEHKLKKKKQKKSKVINILKGVLATILVLVGLVLIFNKQATLGLLSLMEKGHKPPIESKIEPTYDASQVQPANIKDVAAAALKRNQFKPGGQIAIPDIGIHLDIYEGMNSDYLFLGAGEALPRSQVQMGQDGNYILASHRLPEENGTLLFTPLQNSQEGQMIYLTDGKKVYEYVTLWKKTVNANEDTSDINVETEPGEKIITLYTCGDDALKTPFRTVVRGQFVASYDISGNDDPKLEPFLVNGSEVSGYLKYYYLGYY